MGFLFRRGDPLADLRAAHGPARCLRAVPLLQRLTDRPQDIPAVWDRLEPELLPHLPDCPPAVKPVLLRALEDCSAACRNRAVAKQIMCVRDSLVG